MSTASDAPDNAFLNGPTPDLRVRSNHTTAPLSSPYPIFSHSSSVYLAKRERLRCKVRIDLIFVMFLSKDAFEDVR